MNPHVKIQFEINSQHSGNTFIDLLVNPHVKIQFEINSQQEPPIRYLILVNPHVKIQFEINSQQDYSKYLLLSCESSRKNTI